MLSLSGTFSPSSFFTAVVTLADIEGDELGNGTVYDFSFASLEKKEELKNVISELFEDWTGIVSDMPDTHSLILNEAISSNSECWILDDEGGNFYYSIQDNSGETLYRLLIELS